MGLVLLVVLGSFQALLGSLLDQGLAWDLVQVQYQVLDLWEALVVQEVPAALGTQEAVVGTVAYSFPFYALGVGWAEQQSQRERGSSFDQVNMEDQVVVGLEVEDLVVGDQVEDLEALVPSLEVEEHY